MGTEQRGVARGRRNSRPVRVLQGNVHRSRPRSALSSAPAYLRVALLGALCAWGCIAVCIRATPAQAAPPLSWSGPLEVDRGQALNAISCPALGLCVAVDGAGRALLSTRPTLSGAGAWSETFAIRGAGALTSVSCASVNLCVAVDGEGHIAVSTHPTVPGADSWSEAFAIRGAEGLTSVSCASVNLCVAVDRKGHTSVSTNPSLPGSGSWSEALTIDGSAALSSVSCTAAPLCAAVDGEGRVVLSSEPGGGASTWHARSIDPGTGLVAISCFAGGSCVALDGVGQAFASSNAAASIVPGATPGSGATWSSTAFDVFGAPTGLSCAATGLCASVDSTGYAFASANSTAAPPAWLASSIDIQPSAQALKGVACVAEGEQLCAAVDTSGRVFTAVVPAPPPPVVEAVLVAPHPSITGIPAAGQILTCRSGVTASGVTLTYAWLRDTRAIAGAVGSVYAVGSADVSHHLQCRVTATTAAGSESANSSFVTVPAGGLGTIAETVVGAPRVGRGAVSVPLTCSPQAAGSCTLKLSLTVVETLRGSRIVALAAERTRRLSVTVGASTVRLRPGARTTATVKLNAIGRQLLAHARRLAVRLSVSGTVVGAISASLRSATLTLTQPAKASSREASPARPTSTAPSGRLAASATPSTVLAPTPYMGWDSYFTFGGYFDEASVLAQASQLLTRGLQRDGYDYVWLDVGWWHGTRAANGEITVNPAQWPHGMAWLARTLHAAGFKLGVYTDAGSVGCGGAGQGSYGHYQQDVNTFAAWGIDAVKVDFCGGVRLGLQPAAAYTAFHQAIVHNASHRPMLLSICDFLQPGQFANEDPGIENSAFTSYTFGPASGNSWRTDTDVGTPGNVPFTNVLRNLDADAAAPQAAGPGHWNDPDYLGPDQGMSEAQFRTQFSMWAMVAAPLMISADLISLGGPSAAILANREAIAIDQDPAGLQGRLLSASGEGQVWVKPLSDGSRAVALLNRGAGTLRITTTPAAVGMPAAPSGYSLRNVWTGTRTSLGSNGTIGASVPGGSTVLLRIFVK